MMDDKPCPTCGMLACKHKQTQFSPGGKKANKRVGDSGLKVDPVHNKARSQNQERNLGKDYVEAGFPKARRVPMSGAVATLPADVDPGDLILVEAKMSRSGKLVFNWDWLKLVREQAQRDGREGIVHGWFAEATGPYGRVVVLPEEFWMTLLKQYKFMEKELLA